MNKTIFLETLATKNFAYLFNEAGWNAPQSSHPISFEVNEKNFTFNEVANLYARVYVCEVDALPGSAERNALDARLRKLGETYLAIYVHRQEEFHHLWTIPVKLVDKRSLVTIEYATPSQADFLYEKLNNLTFPIGEATNAVTVLDKINKTFAVNANKITKQFYTEFQKKHKAFVAGILNIVDDKDRDWYASVMLNRLMFCYFIQKKGFLNLDANYLVNKLKEVKAKQGEDQFYGTFYKRFLRALFFNGLNAQTHSDDFEDDFGRIPYLNGGMFDVHELERKYPDIDIPDALFEKLFEFFDQWHWHLDTSITSSGKDINPDVLGYIFEQYINDRAQMGAYYTKEDITEYISRNTILPWLFNKLEKSIPAAFKPEGFIWATLKQSGDKYIFASVRKGCELPLPEEIARGIDTSLSNLRERRSQWNKPADDAYALPTEIWRETVARRQRYEIVRAKIANGEITNINDFITYNLDIRTFAQDLIEQTDDPNFIRQMFKALSHVTILDPTCGSGAFLFAALNILEPLYEACITRMQDYPDKFKAELETIQTNYHGNIKYYIYKQIILRNLYGVDIMHEATEIAKLRLFLKMVATVDVDPYDDNLGLDPLPDIDFNIRCGNTLVGFANAESVKKAFTPEDEFVFENEAYNEIERRAADVADLYNRFKTLQQSAEGSADYYAAKQALQSELRALNSDLDLALADRYYNLPYKNLSDAKKLTTWKEKTQPFHWYSEFYNIVIANGGFDVIIGNPPYVELKDVKNYKPIGFATESCANLYALVMERSIFLIKEAGRQGYIVPISSISTDRYKELQKLLSLYTHWYSNYDDRPCRLFENLEHIRLSIHLLSIQSFSSFSTEYQRWNSEEREFLFEKVHYNRNDNLTHLQLIKGSFPKLMDGIELDIINKIKQYPSALTKIRPNGEYLIYYTRKLGSFVQVLNFIPIILDSSNKPQLPSELKIIKFDSLNEANIALLLYNSSLFYWLLKIYSDCRNLNKREIEGCPFNLISDDAVFCLAERLMESFVQYSEMRTMKFKHDKLKIQCIIPRNSKSIIDEIDTLLAKHYGFTEEELDFIINYDIKYRMGDKLND